VNWPQFWLQKQRLKMPKTARTRATRERGRR
jgi:hypothetical protein